MFLFTFTTIGLSATLVVAFSVCSKLKVYHTVSIETDSKIGKFRTFLFIYQIGKRSLTRTSFFCLFFLVMEVVEVSFIEISQEKFKKIV